MSSIIYIIIIYIILYIYEINKHYKNHKNHKQQSIKYYVEHSYIDSTFDTQVKYILSTTKWNKYYNIINVSDKNVADIHIYLVPDEELNMYHKTKKTYSTGEQIRFSYTVQSRTLKPQIYINDKNWLYGVEQSNLSLFDYRRYVINHEFGHGLGYNHLPCDNKTTTNGICPVMYQSTVGCPDKYICGTSPSVKDYKANKLNYNYLQL